MNYRQSVARHTCCWSRLISSKTCLFDHWSRLISSKTSLFDDWFSLLITMAAWNSWLSESNKAFVRQRWAYCCNSPFITLENWLLLNSPLAPKRAPCSVRLSKSSRVKWMPRHLFVRLRYLSPRQNSSKFKPPESSVSNAARRHRWPKPNDLQAMN